MKKIKNSICLLLTLALTACIGLCLAAGKEKPKEPENPKAPEQLREMPPPKTTFDMIFHGDGSFASKLKTFYAIVDITYDEKEVVSNWRVGNRTAFGEVLVRAVKKEANLVVKVKIYDAQGNLVTEKSWAEQGKDKWHNFIMEGSGWHFILEMFFNNQKQDVLVYLG